MPPSRRQQGKARTMGMHPSSLPAGGEGQLFGTKPWTVPPKGTPIPNRPQTAFQPQLPSPTSTISTVQPGPPSPFGQKGLSRYVVRNGNSLQFNKPAVKGALENTTNALEDAKWFRRQGFGAAWRHTLGMEQVASHHNDQMNARRRAAMGENHGITGENPGHVAASTGHPEGYHSGHPASAFESGLSW